MANLTNRAQKPYFFSRGISFILLVIFSQSLHASSILSTPSGSPDISGVWAMLIIGGISFFFCAKGMPKDVPQFDEEGYLIDEEGRNQNV